jgi:hypothetical protein
MLHDIPRSNRSMVDIDIRAMRSNDWPAIQSIYSEGMSGLALPFFIFPGTADGGHVLKPRRFLREFLQLYFIYSTYLIYRFSLWGRGSHLPSTRTTKLSGRIVCRGWGFSGVAAGGGPNFAVTTKT